MSDVFVPFAPAANSSGANGFTPLTLKSFPAAAAKATPGSNGSAAPSAGPQGAGCAPPKVTVQRQGDVVTAVRIQCSCGQVTELNCVY
jgi:hypothetical protein